MWSCGILWCTFEKRNISRRIINEIDDSKKNIPKKREILEIFIKRNSLYSFGLASNEEIDKVNILNATIISMKRALKKFDGFKNTIKIDGQKIFEYNENTFFYQKR